MYIVWRLSDPELNLWLPTNCDTFDQASHAWLDILQSGGRGEIMERVPVALRDARMSPTEKPSQRRGVRDESRAVKIIKALQSAPDGLSRKQLAAATGYTKTDAGSTVAGLMKVGRARAEQRPPDAERGTAAVGQSFVTVYFPTEKAS